MSLAISIYSGVQLQNVAKPPGEDDSSDAAAEIRQEEGCYFLLYDQRSPLMKRPQASISGRRLTDCCRAGTIAAMNRRRLNHQN